MEERKCCFLESSTLMVPHCVNHEDMFWDHPKKIPTGCEGLPHGQDVRKVVRSNCTGIPQEKGLGLLVPA
jgi:hypothetical protein